MGLLHWVSIRLNWRRQREPLHYFYTLTRVLVHIEAL